MGRKMEVDPGELLALADRIRADAAMLSGTPAWSGQAATPHAAGDPALAGAIAGFERAWGGFCAELDDDLARVADLLTASATLYQDVEGGSHTLFHRLTEYLW